MAKRYISDGSSLHQIKKRYFSDGSSWHQIKKSYVSDGSAWHLFFENFHAVGTTSGNYIEPGDYQVGWGADDSLEMDVLNWADNDQGYATCHAILTFDDPIEIPTDIACTITFSTSHYGTITDREASVQAYDSNNNQVLFGGYGGYNNGQELNTSGTMNMSNYYSRSDIRHMEFYMNGHLYPNSELTLNIPAGGIIIGSTVIDEITIQ